MKKHLLEQLMYCQECRSSMSFCMLADETGCVLGRCHNALCFAYDSGAGYRLETFRVGGRTFSVVFPGWR